jgi:alkylation response protein AidB-like acyl-CoA dehydrogenase
VDPTLSGVAQQFRDEVQAFLKAHLPVDGEAEEWRETLHHHGLLAPSWPREYGGAGLSPLEQIVLAAEFAAAGVRVGSLSDYLSIQMFGNTLLRWGTEGQKRFFLPRALSGEHRWCQGFSEPGAGSDLGSLSTHAHVEGDDWVINGQKVWTSGARSANWIFLLCRTDPAAPKHQGISFLLCPMNQPGIEVRPIRMLTGDSEFAEVFFTDARTSREHVVGEVNAGWRVAMSILGHERGQLAVTFPVIYRTALDRLVDLARSRSLDDDPGIRQEIARLYSAVEIVRFMGLRTVTALLRDEAPGPEVSAFKLLCSEHHQRVTNLAVRVLGMEATVPEGDPPALGLPGDRPDAENRSGWWVGEFLLSRAATIYAGTSEMRRNTIAELVLGLPRHSAVGGDQTVT